MDNKDFKKGDKVTLEVAGRTDSGRVLFKTTTKVGSLAAWLDMEKILVHGYEPAPEPPLQVGDLVKVGDDIAPHTRKIRAIDGEFAWVSSETIPGGLTVKLTRIKRVAA